MKICGVSDSMSSPFMLSLNTGLVQNMEYQPFRWADSTLSPEQGIESFPNVIVKSPALEMRPEEDVKKKINERVREKRRLQGKCEDFPEEKRPRKPPPTVQKEEDPDKVRIRRERNKIAATKCRQRRRERMKYLRKKIDDLQSDQRKMIKEISSLKRNKAMLEHACTNRHWCVISQQQPAQTQSRASTSSCTQTTLNQMSSYF